MGAIGATALSPAREPARSGMRLGRLAVWSLALGSLGAFLEIAVLIHLHAFDVSSQAPSAPSLGWFLSVHALSALPRFTGLALAGVAIAATGRRLAAVAPSFLFAIVPVALGRSAPPITEAAGWPSPWVGALVEALVACGPAVAVMLTTRPGPDTVRGSRWQAMLGVSLVAVPAGLVFLTVRVVEGRLPAETIAAAAALFVVGLAVGRRPGWWPWSHVGIAVLIGFPFQVARADPVGIAAAWAPLLAVVLWSAQHDRVVRGWGRLTRSPLRLVIALNALNVADALLTQFAIDQGRALEANPVVAAAGMGAKIVLVAVVSLILYRIRPRALIVPCFLLASVLAYHAAGWTW